MGTPFAPAAVAQALVAGLSHRLYHLPSPDFLQNRLVDTMVGVTPRNNAVLEWLTLPLLALVEWLFLRSASISPPPPPRQSISSRISLACGPVTMPGFALQPLAVRLPC